MTDRITYCDLFADDCTQCPRYGKDCDGMDIWDDFFSYTKEDEEQ